MKTTVEVTVEENCGNAPKKEFLRDSKIAFAKENLEYVVDQVTDDITWHIVGDKRIEGKENFGKEIEAMSEVKATELVLNYIITHGRSAAVEGTIKLEDDSSYSFCEVYAFRGLKNPKIKEMTSYVIKT